MSIERISVSQIDSFIKCPFKWYGQYRLKIKQPKKMSLTFGNVFDDTINQEYLTKSFSFKDMPIKELKEVFEAKLLAELPTVELFDDNSFKKKSKIKDYGVKAVEIFYAGVCKYVKPSEVQPYLKMSFKDSPILMYAKPDVIEISETIRDTKTAGKIWSQSKAEQSLQPLAYSLFKDGIGKNIRREFFYDILVKTNKPKIQQVKIIVDDNKRKNFLTFMSSVVKQINNGLETNNFPNSAFYRNDPLCAKRYCPVWQTCEKQNRIKIKE